MKVFLKVIAILLAVVIVIGAGAYTYATWGMKKIQQQTIGAVDLTQLPDGNYKGTYKNARWSNTVEVVVKEGKIVDVVIVDDVKMPLEGVKEKLIDEVIAKQNIDGDAISSATATSHSYLMAMEDALEQ